jgi:hypothetical protein
MLVSEIARADQCSTLRQQRERIEDQVTELKVNHPFFTGALEGCAKTAKDNAEFGICALAVCVVGKDTCRAVAAQIFDLAVRKARIDQLAKQAGCNGPGRPPGALGVCLAESEEVDPTGVEIASVLPEAPAGPAGLRAGDVVVALNGEVVSARSDLIDAVRAAGAGSSVRVRIQRGGRLFNIPVVLARADSLRYTCGTR